MRVAVTVLHSCAFIIEIAYLHSDSLCVGSIVVAKESKFLSAIIIIYAYQPYLAYNHDLIRIVAFLPLTIK